MAFRYQLAFYLTQALDVINNNLVKYGFLFALAFLPLGKAFDQQASLLISNLVATIYIIPFFVVSYWAGSAADTRDKLALIQNIKVLDVLIIFSIFLCFYYSNAVLLLLMIGLLGVKAAAFTPVKFAYMVENFRHNDLVLANGIVQTTSLTGILTAVLCAGLIIGSFESSAIYGALLLFISIIGFVLSRTMSSLERGSSQTSATSMKMLTTQKKVALNKRQIRSLFQDMKEAALAIFCLVSIGWFWFLGTSFLTQFMNYVKLQLHGSALLAAMTLSIFVAGMSAGTLFCRKTRWPLRTTFMVSGLGLSILSYCVAQHNVESAGLTLLCVLIAGLGFMSTIFFVPLFTTLQTLSPVNRVASLMGLCSISNACFVVLSSLFALLVLGLFDAGLVHYFGYLSLLNLVFVAGASLWLIKIKRASGRESKATQG